MNFILIKFMELLQKLTELLKYATNWFDQYILANLGWFIRGLIELLIKIFQFFIDALNWVLQYVR
ncbi:hypothetical protein COY31_02385 [Candidatus Wolfebacteria bacterium CG_4_10_14_0_2_um_filter_39_18]|uniref:Uncharacterized protein n=1 Tax=Candidatus Wolfebacteria bacterium CG_4_10_14_0_2_um_filter_39_18 TaxID=1975061 RepID=A0A2M7TFC3_9BACT|nr:MAG: hypothetical protein COY31_02385 [Candidatus Wolfebacteria bacterium CG_4_10_14_0_2_um_filter_39_18]